MNQTFQRLWHSGTLLATATALASTVGCAGSNSEIAQAQPTPTTEIEQPEQPEQTEFEVLLGEMSEVDVATATPAIEYESPVETVAASSEGTPPIVVQTPTEDAPASSIETGEDGPAQPDALASDSAEPDDGLAVGSGEPEPPSLESQIEEAMRSLRALIADSGDRALSPYGAMFRIALLESVQPGVFEATYGTIDDASEFAGLTPDEREVLRSTLDLASSLRGELDPGLVDLDRIVRAIDDASTAMRAVKMLTIEDARLCLRVDNFGVYREVERYDDRYKFIAGTPHPVIVYTELDHFTRTPSNRDGVDGYVVNVQQALKIYRTGTEIARDSENTLVWQMDAQPVVDFSRRQLRDFFIVQVIELPANLSVGSYRMKVIATDIATGEQVERAIDFDMIADASALRTTGFAQSLDTGPYNPGR
ncbi:MAG: hypothetical protein ACIAQF_08465 [Phycisphaerales bacterium JB065]